jgi:polyphosphate kinase 2 (PPK2 family)
MAERVPGRRWSVRRVEVGARARMSKEKSPKKAAPSAKASKEQSPESDSPPDKMTNKDYKRELAGLSVEIVKLQEWVKR